VKIVGGIKSPWGIPACLAIDPPLSIRLEMWVTCILSVIMCIIMIIKFYRLL